MASYKTLIRVDNSTNLEYTRIFGKSLGPTSVPDLLPIETSLEALTAKYPLIDFEGYKLIPVELSIKVNREIKKRIEKDYRVLVFADERTFMEYVAEHKPKEIWLDSSSTTQPHIKMLEYTSKGIRGAVFEDIAFYINYRYLPYYFKTGMYVRLGI